MYLSFFGLQQSPFQALPTPSFYVNFTSVEDAALSTLFAITSGKGLIKVTGGPGTGKTVMVARIDEQLPINYRKLSIRTPCSSSESCLNQLCHEIGISVSERDTELRLIAKLHQAFLQEFSCGYRTIIFVDNAHLFRPEVLKTLCLLSCLKARENQKGDKLVQVVLLGTPALNGLLKTPALENWGQRIKSHIEMPKLDEVEVMHYINYRMKAAGYSKAPMFDLKTARKIQKLTSGVPEVINRVADRLLSIAYMRGDNYIKPLHLREVASSYQDKMHYKFSKVKALLLMASLTLIAALVWKSADSSLMATAQKQYREWLPISSLWSQKAKQYTRFVFPDKPVLILGASSTTNLNQRTLVLKQLIPTEQNESISVLSNDNIESGKLHQLIFCNFSQLSPEDRAQRFVLVKRKLSGDALTLPPISKLVFQAREQGLI